MYKSKQASVFYKHYQILKQVEQESDDLIDDIEQTANYVKKNYSTKKENILKTLSKIQKNISTILILDNDGILQNFASNVKTDTFKGYDYSNTKYFQAIKNGDSKYWSKAYLSQVTNLPAISYTIRIDKNTIAVFIINLKSLNKLASKFQGEDGFSIIRILDKNGIFLAHPDQEKFVLERKNILNSDIYKNYIQKNHKYKQIVFQGYGKIKNIGVYGVTKKLKWYIIIKESSPFLFKTFNQLMWFTTAFILFLIAISIFFSIRLSKSILKPLDMVSANMENIAQGKSAKTIRHTKYEELNILVDNFTLMQDKVKDREQILQTFNEKLEHKVDEKTKLLSQANLELEQSKQNLQILNENLESKVKEEVKKNIDKEKLLAQQSKMASMGEMLENIAHQWRQPLSVISTASSGIKMQKEFGFSSEEKELKILDTITTTAEHLSSTIDDFRDFFKSDQNKKTYSLQKAYDRTINILESKFKNKNIEIIENIEDIEFYGREGEFIQVIMNILNNARDILETKEQRRLIFITIFTQDNDAIIQIKDNGGGIPDQIINNIFDPYFTTKHKSQGTGIGLYMSEEMIRKHMKGSIEAINEDFTYEQVNYKGACFKISLPLKLKDE
jgi:signal transduction histidine kinase